MTGNAKWGNIMRMTRATTILLLAGSCLLLAGCPARTSVYAPRLNNTDFHREAIEKGNCLDCHEPEQIRLHKPQDACRSCHIICRGC